MWGTAPAGARVAVSLLTGDAPQRLVANSTVMTSGGRFLAEFPPQPPGPRETPTRHTIRAVLLGGQPSDSTSAELVDVLFGQVVLCGGQSNMQFSVGNASNATARLAVPLALRCPALVSPASQYSRCAAPPASPQHLSASEE